MDSWGCEWQKAMTEKDPHKGNLGDVVVKGLLILTISWLCDSTHMLKFTKLKKETQVLL